MALQTTTERLQAVETAIIGIETGAQEYQTLTFEVKRAKLADLYKERRTLQGELARENGSNPTLSTFSFSNVGRG